MSCGFADEDGFVGNVGIAVDLLDHLGVVVGGQEGFRSPPSGIRSHPTKSVRKQKGPVFSSGFSRR
jgi:hypothetical protein